MKLLFAGAALMTTGILLPARPAAASELYQVDEVKPIYSTPEGMQREQEHHEKFQKLIDKFRKQVRKIATLKPGDGTELPLRQKP